MYHQELSQVMSQRGLFGLGDWLSKQVMGSNNAAKALKAYEQDGFVLPSESLAPLPLDMIEIRQEKDQADG
jgi:Rod binding domain-containing protein